MQAYWLLLLSILLYVAGAIASLLLNGSRKSARVVSGIGGAAGSLVAILVGVLSLAAEPPKLALLAPVPFGNFTMQIDGLSALMVTLIGALGFATSLYSISYLELYENRSLGVLGFFNNLFMAAMVLVVTVDNAFYFLIFWEVMTLASYFLVIFEQEKKEAVTAGYLYMLVAHAGAALILIAFLVMFLHTGSFTFDAFRSATFPPYIRDLVFLLGFVGFGAKAGVIPMHIWLPRAHPAAPSHASALLSGVMIKTAIYGILRLSLDILAAPPVWWGILILVFGAISAVLGVIYAIVERDVKRLLAYSSVENIGIILMGVGIGMIGLANQQASLAVIGFLAAIYHMVNHGFFKGLLFLGAGSLIYGSGTRSLDAMGGLARRMPWTAAAFLVGALAVSAIPPLNGFVSEWYLFQAFFSAAGTTSFITKVLVSISAALLALTGALAAMCFLKAYGSAFSGPARSKAARETSETPVPMIAGLLVLAAGSLGLGIGAPLVVPLFNRIAAGMVGVDVPIITNAIQVTANRSSPSIISPPLIAVLLIGLLTVPLLLVLLFGGRRAARRRDVDPWACGYGYKPVMSATGSSFNQPILVTFRSMFNLRKMVDRPIQSLSNLFSRATSFFRRNETDIERVVTRPVATMVVYIGRHIQALQMGDVRVYCLYVIATLAILMIIAAR